MFLSSNMPEQPPRSRHLIWTLSQAHGVQQIVRVRCGHCPGKRHYLPCDLQQLLGDVDVQRLSRLMRCQQCGNADEIETHVFITGPRRFGWMSGDGSAQD